MTLKRKHNRHFLCQILYLALLIGISVPWTGGCGRSSAENPSVARVGRAVLTEDMLKNVAGERLYGPDSVRMRNQIINRWIEQEILYQGALKAGHNEDEEINSEISQLRKQLVTGKFLDREFENQLTSTEDDLLDYYQKNIDKFLAEENSFVLQHITVETAKEARNIIAETKKGTSLEEMNIEGLEISTGFLSLLQNPIREELIPKTLLDNIRKLKVGETGTQIRYEDKYHIIKVVDKILKDEPIPLKYIHEKVLEQFYIRRRKEGYIQLVKQLRDEMDVYVYSRQGDPMPLIEARQDSLIFEPEGNE